MAQILYERIIKYGTVNEPNGKPEPQFALPATVNWMRSLRIVCDENKTCFEEARSAYLKMGCAERNRSDLEINSIFEQLFLALHHLSALSALNHIGNRSDAARIGIMGWYYGTYNLASAMICARDGSLQETHEATARQWYSQIVCNQLCLPPFDTKVSSLVKRDSDVEIKASLNYGKGTLKRTPTSLAEAQGALLEYTSGTANWYRWKKEEEVKRSKDFKALGRSDFRSRAAREMRDAQLKRRQIGFLHQAFRYRGKANYREALFLSYGANTNTILEKFISDMQEVLTAFVAMGGAYCSVTLGDELWNAFVQDVQHHAAFSMPVIDVWAKI